MAVSRLLNEYNLYGSAKKYSAINRAGEPIPWIAFPAYEQLEQWDLSMKSVFEFGGGNSTLYWARKAFGVVSVEDDKEWFDNISPQLPENAVMHYGTDENYLDFIQGKFDIIMVDSDDRFRVKAALIAPEHLNPGGVIILDNADNYGQAAEYLRSQGFNQIDFSGPCPIVDYWSTTSFFFKGNHDFKPKYMRQPIYAIGRGFPNRTKVIHKPLSDYLS